METSRKRKCLSSEPLSPPKSTEEQTQEQTVEQTVAKQQQILSESQDGKDHKSPKHLKYGLKHLEINVASPPPLWLHNILEEVLCSRGRFQDLVLQLHGPEHAFIIRLSCVSKELSSILGSVHFLRGDPSVLRQESEWLRHMSTRPFGSRVLLNDNLEYDGEVWFGWENDSDQVNDGQTIVVEWSLRTSVQQMFSGMLRDLHHSKLIDKCKIMVEKNRLRL
jgi:hypothetical protein